MYISVNNKKMFFLELYIYDIISLSLMSLYLVIKKYIYKCVYTRELILKFITPRRINTYMYISHHVYL
jgi:hypothetical protein